RGPPRAPLSPRVPPGGARPPHSRTPAAERPRATHRGEPGCRVPPDAPPPATARPARAPDPAPRRGSGRALRDRSLQEREVPFDLERRDERPVLLPLPSLVTEEPLEDVLAERLRHDLVAFHVLHCLDQALREGCDADGTSLLGRHRVDVVRR